MPKYRKLPVEIEAIEWNDRGAFDDYQVIAFTLGAARRVGRDRRFVIRTLEGEMIVSPGDFVIKGVNGEFYPCKPDIFWKTYERVD